jgi:hypothetical protein
VSGLKESSIVASESPTAAPRPNRKGLTYPCLDQTQPRQNSGSTRSSCPSPSSRTGCDSVPPGAPRHRAKETLARIVREAQERHAAKEADELAREKVGARCRCSQTSPR